MGSLKMLSSIVARRRHGKQCNYAAGCCFSESFAKCMSASGDPQPKRCWVWQGRLDRPRALCAREKSKAPMQRLTGHTASGPEHRDHLRTPRTASLTPYLHSSEIRRATLSIHAPGSNFGSLRRGLTRHRGLENLNRGLSAWSDKTSSFHGCRFCRTSILGGHAQIYCLCL